MKPDRSSEGKDPLGQLLHEWRVEPELPPRFAEQVWRRIAAEETRLTETGWWHRCKSLAEMLFARPAFATACVLVFLLAGTAAGWWQGRQEVARLDDTMGLRYVQSVDPFSMPRH